MIGPTPAGMTPTTLRQAAQLRSPVFIYRLGNLERIVGLRKWAHDYRVTTEAGECVVSRDHVVFRSRKVRAR